MGHLRIDVIGPIRSLSDPHLLPFRAFGHVGRFALVDSQVFGLPQDSRKTAGPVVYELADPQAWYAEEWQKHLTDPTEWSQRMSPSIIGQNYIRNLYMLVYPTDVPAETADSGMAPALLVGRMSVPQPVEARFNQIYNQERLPLYRSIPGYIRARRFAAVLGEPKYMTVHECEPLRWPEARIWRGCGSLKLRIGPITSILK